MKTLSFLIVCLVLFESILPASARVAKVGPNVDITATNDGAERQQAEPTIAVDPRNPSIIAAGAQDYRLLAVGEHRWHGYYRSTDGGQTWSFSLLPGFPSDMSATGLSSPLHGFDATTDPVMAFDRMGNLYYVGITSSFVLFVAKYVNDGANYAGVIVFPQSSYLSADKPWVAVDTSRGPNSGNVYITYDGFNDTVFGSFLIRSTDGGRTFSSPELITPNGFFTGVTVSPQGKMFVSAMAPYGNSTTLEQLLVLESDDGGLSFNEPQFVALATSLPGTLPNNRFRTFDPIPQIASDSQGVYVVWADYTSGNSNVMFARQGNNERWDEPIRVNNVVQGQHFFPSVAASNGVVSVAWYDSRLNTLDNGTIIGLDVFYAEFQHQDSFGKNLRITSVSFNPNAVQRADFGDSQPFIGDYIEVASMAGIAHVIWTDNRSACDHVDPTFGCTDQDILTATIS